MLTKDEKEKINSHKRKLHKLPMELQTKLKDALFSGQFKFDPSPDEICCDTGTGPHGIKRMTPDDCAYFGGTPVDDSRCPQ